MKSTTKALIAVLVAVVASVEEEKRNRAFDDIANRRRIQVAEEFVVGDPGAATPKPPAKGKSAAPRTSPAPKAPARRKP